MNALGSVRDKIGAKITEIAGPDPFYMAVITVAIIFLLIILISIGVMMSTLKSLDNYPPIQNTCPDYWDISANASFCTFPTGTTSLNQGQNIKTSINGAVYLDGSSPFVQSWAPHLNMTSALGEKYQDRGNNANNFKYLQLNNNESGWQRISPGLTTRCAQKQWALNNGIVWDGVSNFNGC